MGSAEQYGPCAMSSTQASDNNSDLIGGSGTNPRQEGQRPLRACVREAVEDYFAQLDGHTTTGLYRLVMHEVEAPLLEAVLRHTGGNQSRAADVLGLNRGTLRKKLKSHNLG